VDAQLDIDRRGMGAVTRVSPHYFVTDDELDRAVTVVAEIADSPASWSAFGARGGREPFQAQGEMLHALVHRPAGLLA